MIARLSFEKTVNKVQNLIEMMDLIKMNGSDPNMAPIAETAKNELKNRKIAPSCDSYFNAV